MRPSIHKHFYTYSEEEKSNLQIMSDKICISKYSQLGQTHLGFFEKCKRLIIGVNILLSESFKYFLNKGKPTK
jgi:hypothetical protein